MKFVKWQLKFCKYCSCQMATIQKLNPFFFSSPATVQSHIYVIIKLCAPYYKVLWSSLRFSAILWSCDFHFFSCMCTNMSQQTTGTVTLILLNYFFPTYIVYVILTQITQQTLGYFTDMIQLVIQTHGRTGVMNTAKCVEGNVFDCHSCQNLMRVYNFLHWFNIWMSVWTFLAPILIVKIWISAPKHSMTLCLGSNTGNIPN